MEEATLMHIYIPLWIPLAYLAIGILLQPYIFFRVHVNMRHNIGWTWATTFFGRRYNRPLWKYILRVVVGYVLQIVLWPWALREL